MHVFVRKCVWHGEGAIPSDQSPPCLQRRRSYSVQTEGKLWPILKRTVQESLQRHQLELIWGQPWKGGSKWCWGTLKRSTNKIVHQLTKLSMEEISLMQRTCSTNWGTLAPLWNSLFCVCVRRCWEESAWNDRCAPACACQRNNENPPSHQFVSKDS